MSNEYDDLLNRTWDEIPEPVALPEGSWSLKAINAKYAPNEDNEKMGPTVNVVLKAVEPMSDVDEEDLAALGDNYDVTGNTIYHKFFLRDGGIEAVRRFLSNLGVLDGSKTVTENLKDVKGQPVVGFLKQRKFTTKAGEEVVQNVVSAFAVAE